LLTHRGEVDDAGHTGEVLHHHAGRGELDLGVRFGAGIPAAEGLDMLRSDVRAVFRAQQVLQQHLEAEGKLLGPWDLVEAIDLIILIAHGQVLFDLNVSTLLIVILLFHLTLIQETGQALAPRTDLRDTYVSKSILTSR